MSSAQSTVNFDPTQILWVEKYRPSTLEDCILPERIKNDFRGFVRDKDFPSLLLSGSAGIGKTTLAKALCQDLNMDWILINASNERGVDVLRTTITQFATSVSFNDCKIKCIIMDEFDQATPLLQTAMRAAIEDFSKTCRFIFTCNYPNKIIDPIHSRCSNISLALEPEEKKEIAIGFLRRLELILKNEGVEYEKKALAAIIQKYFPDFRRVINELQRASKTGAKIDLDLIETSVGGEDLNISKLVKALKEKDFPAMRQWVAQNVGNDVNLLFRKVYDQLHVFLQPAFIPEAIIKIAEYQYRGTTCPDPEINFVAFCVEMMALEYK
jgi:replication factor C small subunit